jgi:hypothetical protein
VPPSALSGATVGPPSELAGKLICTTVDDMAFPPHLNRESIRMVFYLCRDSQLLAFAAKQWKRADLISQAQYTSTKPTSIDRDESLT